MDVLIHPDAADAGRAVADIVERLIRDGGQTLGLSTGTSPLLAYQELIRRHHTHELTFAAVRAYILDEYLGLPAEHPQSYHATIRRELAGHVDFNLVDGPDGMASDPHAEADRYEQTITVNGPIDAQILGIGRNGHLGFNEPGSSLRSRTRVVTLTEQTRRDNARFFETPEEVPRTVITQGLGTISHARHLIVIATGAHKAHAVAAAVEGPVTASCPASVLQLHPHVTIALDEPAAGRLQAHAYYREAHATTARP